MVTIADIDALLVEVADEPDSERMLRQLPPEDWSTVEEAGGRLHTTVTREGTPVSKSYFANRDVLLKLREAIATRDGERPVEPQEPTTENRFPATASEEKTARVGDFDHGQNSSPDESAPETADPPANVEAESGEGVSSPAVGFEGQSAGASDFDHGQNLGGRIIEEIGLTTGLLMETPVLHLADVLSADPDEAHQSCQDYVWKLHRAGCLVGLYAGQVFTIIEDRELWKGRAESYVDYLRSDEFNPLGYDTTRRLQRIYRTFCKERGLTPEEIHTVEVKKLDAIVAHERKLRKAGRELSNEEIVELTHEARELTRANLHVLLREIRGEQGPEQPDPVERLLMAYQRLDDDERAAFKRGIQSIDSGTKRFEQGRGWVGASTEPPPQTTGTS